MKSKKNLLEQLKPLPYFTKSTVYQLGEQLGLMNSTIDTYISRFLRYKEIIQLKNGLYVSTDFYIKNKSNSSYLFYLANIIRKPSYVSSWTALQYYNLTTDVIHTITSVTTKVTRNYVTKIGVFPYRSIKEDLFSDFHLNKGTFNFFIASPAKSLFDMLYFKTHQLRGVQLKDIDYLLNELRIDMDEMDKVERKKFYSIIKNHIRHE